MTDDDAKEFYRMQGRFDSMEERLARMDGQLEKIITGQQQMREEVAGNRQRWKTVAFFSTAASGVCGAAIVKVLPAFLK